MLRTLTFSIVVATLLTSSSASQPQPRPATRAIQRWGDVVAGLRLALSLNGAEVKAGDAIIATVVVQNATEHDLRFQESIVEKDFLFQVETEDGSRVLHTDYGEHLQKLEQRSFVPAVLKPKQTVTYRFNLNRRFDMSLARHYRVRVCRYAQSLQPPDRLETVSSDVAEIKVLDRPPERVKSEP